MKLSRTLFRIGVVCIMCIMKEIKTRFIRLFVTYLRTVLVHTTYQFKHNNNSANNPRPIVENIWYWIWGYFVPHAQTFKDSWMLNRTVKWYFFTLQAVSICVTDVKFQTNSSNRLRAFYSYKLLSQIAVSYMTFWWALLLAAFIGDGSVCWQTMSKHRF